MIFRSAWGMLIVSWLMAGLAARGDPAVTSVPLTEGIRWNAGTGRLDVRIPGWPLSRALGRLARATGWSVFIEPGSDQRVSSTFQGLPPEEALPRILGDLSYMVIGDGKGQKLLVYRTSAGSATELVPDQSSGRIPDELLVALRKDAIGKADAIAAQLGAKIVARSDKLGLYRLKFGSEAEADAALKLLQENPDVVSSENNLRFERPDPVSGVPPSGAGEFSLRAKVVGDRDRLIVGLVDTVAQSLGPAYDAFMLPGISVASGQPESDRLLHGSAMAGTILQGSALTQKAGEGSPIRILPVDVYGGGETTTTFEVALGIKRAIEGGASIINLSLGTPDDSPYMHNLIRDITSQGALVLAAPGNQPVTTPSFPAAYPEVLAVTAGDARGQLAGYANRGGFVDVMAPGTSVVPFNGRRWMINGTSVSTAYASGIAAGLLNQPGMTPAKVLDDLRRNLPLPAGFTSAPAAAAPPARVSP